MSVKWIALLAASMLILSASAGDAFACRNHLQSARIAIGSQVQELGVIESKLLSRLTGANTPTYASLARETWSIIADLYPQDAVVAERRYRRCRNWVPPVRRTCRDAAVRLVSVIQESASDHLTEETRLEYARLISRCEMWLALPRRSSLLRIP